MKTVIIKREDFYNWINAQDPNRPVIMSETKGTDLCGCAMVQYAREHLKDLQPKDIDCGFTNFTIYGNRKGGHYDLDKMPSFFEKDCKTFGDLQLAIKE